ncbi:hypothetical protein TWF481_006275 [Arthrobotrys musiformis]|uniref:Uncharacterized protein n=1 Tax=Arthrobotrys musiformis TaxID=47236 RepID=A0AAV9WLX7_9PEZI
MAENQKRLRDECGFEEQNSKRICLPGLIPSPAQGGSCISKETDFVEWEAVQLEDRMFAETRTQHVGATTSVVNICYGALTEVKAEVTHIQSPSSIAQPWTSFHSFNLRNQGGTDTWLLAEPNGTYFGRIDFLTASRLRGLRTLRGVSLCAVLASSDFDKIPRQTSRKRPRIDITINITGPEDFADTVGRTLEDAGAYLQHPVFLEAGIKYANPHYFYVGDGMIDLRHLIGPAPTAADVQSQRMSRAVEDAMESLGRARIPMSHSVDLRILEELLFTSVRLKPHQLEGVRFILTRENISSSTIVDREFLQLIDSRLLSQNLSPCRGGIIADVMGLGKTLTMLSAIAYVRKTADSYPGPTLVVLPSRQVLDVWDLEIRSRFRPGVMKVYTFHNDSRAKSAGFLKDCDIVLTTYHTLAADSKRAQVLQSITWLRIVLDEAHWIRNQSTQLFKATDDLRSEARWCLTGTPIQNSLHDLRSLLRFLRFSPLWAKSLFEKHIIDPLRTGSETCVANLQYLLRIICLRRNSSLLELPPLDTRMVPVTLHAEERRRYDGILAECKTEFERQVCTGQKPKMPSFLFSTIMKLRRLCNHGTAALGADASRSFVLSPTSENAGKDMCQFCSFGVSHFEATFTTPEGCPECGRLVETDRTSSQEAALIDLAIAAANIRPTITDYGLLSPTSSEFSLSPGSQGFTPSGFSSKLRAVVANLHQLSISGSKSIVFTSWRSTLDILGRMLSDIGIDYLRVDGSTNPLHRSSIVNRFQEDPSITVLIMTINSCAVGVTLTKADQVHMIEPQWNPAVEEQAIARAYRMGQTKAVTVIRYITEKTVEENIIALQAKKSRLAKFSMNDTTDGDFSGALEDMKFVLNPTY